jgi:ElaB/YqjD/DUF883 family membrane-anchored ribosome-binding protein
MDHKTEVIKSQMEETRASLTDKLETLEQQVVETVQDATSAVTDTVENVTEAVKDTVDTVKESVEGTVEAVQETFDLRLQVERYPWVVMGGSVVVGFIAGRLVDGLTRAPGSHAEPEKASSSSAAARENGGGRPFYSEGAASRRTNPATEGGLAEQGWLHSLAEHFGPELTKLKSLAIGTALGVFRDLVKPLLPEQLGDKVHGLVDDMTQRLGGEPIPGPLVSESTDRGLASEATESKRQPNGFNQSQTSAVGANRGSSEVPPFNRR